MGERDFARFRDPTTVMGTKRTRDRNHKVMMAYVILRRCLNETG